MFTDATFKANSLRFYLNAEVLCYACLFILYSIVHALG